MSFLPESDRAHDFIWTSLAVLRRECPQAYGLMCQQMAGRALLLAIDGEQVGLRFTSEETLPLALDAEGRPPSLRLLTSWQAILDLADARLTVVEAALQGRLELYGGAGELALFYDAILTYLRGAVRCPSFPAILEQARLIPLK